MTADASRRRAARRAWARYAAAVELEEARNVLRMCVLADRATIADRLRVTAAEGIWDMEQIRQWRVTSCR